MVDRTAAEADRALERIESGERAGEGRFSGPGFTDDAEDFTRLHRDADVAVAGDARARTSEQRVDERAASIVDADALGTDQWIRCHRGCPAGEPSPRLGHRIEQHSRVGVLRCLEYGVDRALLDDTTAMNHRDAVAHRGYDSEIVRYIERGDLGFGLQFGEQIEDLPRSDHVERRRRFVEHNALGLARECAGDDDALFLSTGGLMRIAPHHGARGTDADPGQQRLAFAPCLLVRESSVSRQHFGELFAQRQRRIERGRRILEHHPDAPTAQRSDLRGRGSHQIGIRKLDPARLPGAVRQIAHHAPGKGRLSRS